jgi:hypothetical protein
MTSVADQKSYWNLLETVRWICARNEERVAAMWDMDEEEQMAVVMFDPKPKLDHPSSLLIMRGTDPTSDRDVARPQETSNSSHTDDIIIMGPQEALDDLLRKVRSRRVQMTAVRCHGGLYEQDPVPPTELNDLSFRLHPDYPNGRVGLWSRSRNVLVWRSPQFSRADVIGVWPGRKRKTAAAFRAILQHLRKISTPQAPLTQSEAKQRCMAEVPGAYAEAFKKAWANLEPAYKRGRGKHGPRALTLRETSGMKTSGH